MVFYNDATLLKQQHDLAKFYTLTGPGEPAPYSGIYSCNFCKHQIVSTKGNKMPPECHSNHPDPKKNPIQWQLIAAAH